MIAVLDAIAGHEDALAHAITVLTAAVRREPGCVEFRAFQQTTHPGRFYLYEIYTDSEAFETHLATDHVQHFFTALAAHSISDASALVQLLELDPTPG